MVIYPITIPGGSNTQIQINDGGIFGAFAHLTLNKTTGVTTATGVTVTGNSVLGLNSAVFQPTTDQTDFFQIKDAAGTGYAGVFDTTKKRFGIGTNAPTANLHIIAPSLVSREALIRCTIFDAGYDTFGVANGTTTDSRFSPTFYGYVDSHVFTSMAFRGLVRAVDDSSDASSAGIISFDALRTSSESDPVGGTYSVVENRKLFTFGTLGIRYVTIAASGYVGIGAGATAPETLLEMTGTAPYITLHNSTHENTDGGRESRIIGKGEQGVDPFTESALAQYEMSHDGTLDDQLGKIIESVNTGAGLVAVREVDSSGNTKIGDAGVTNYTNISATGTVSFNGSAGIIIPHLMQSDTTDQSIANVTLGQAITFDTDVHHSGITRTSSSVFTITKTASYLITFSAICQSDVAGKRIGIWLKKDSTNIVNSNTYYTFKVANSTAVVTVTYIYHFTAGETFSLWMWGDSTGIKLDATAAVAFSEGVLPAVPACPSIIMTANYIGVD